MTPVIAWAAAAGLGLGFGLVVVLRSLPMMNRPSFEERVAPMLRSSAAGGVDLFHQPQSLVSLSVAQRIFGPVVREALKQLDRFSIDADQLRRRLDQADAGITVSEYRIQQLGYAAAGALLAAGANAAAFFSGSFHGVIALISILVLTVLGFALRDNMLSARVRRRQARMLSEFPTVAEMIALAVSAGESAPGAFERVSRVSRGELNAELRKVLAQTRAGTSFTHALKHMSARVQSPPISRFLEGIIVAMERGTPLADVMHAQAQDVRDLGKRELMETAGRKELSMLVPVVFGILPLTVVFAVFPGLELLSLGP